MIIREIRQEAVWNSFVTSLPRYTFLHSWQWGLLQERLGENVAYLGFYEDERLCGVALVITVRARRGQHFLVPHGPLFASETAVCDSLALLTSYLKQQNTPAVALRVAPLLLNTAHNRTRLAQAGFRPAPLHVHAELTWELDSTRTTEKIMRGMRKTTRHAITKAAEAGVTTTILSDATALNRFLPLYEQTRQRHGFVPFSRNFLRSQLEIFGPEHSFTVLAHKGGRDLAAAIIITFGNAAYYYHGASVTDSALPAAHAVQWAAIREAKRRGATRYNFWGIAPADQAYHPFAGITIFKKGFGGYPIDYLHAHDLPLAFGYGKLWLTDTWRKYRRGF